MAKKKSARKTASSKSSSSKKKSSGGKKRSTKRKGTSVKATMGKAARKATGVVGEVLKGAAVGAMKGATETVERKTGKRSSSSDR